MGFLGRSQTWGQCPSPNSLGCVNRAVVSQSTREGALRGNRQHCCSSNLHINFWAVSKYLYIILMSGCYFRKGLFIHFRVCGIFFLYFVKDRQIWGSDWLQGGVSDTVVSSTTSRSIFESSNSGRIRRPRSEVRLEFSKCFEFGGSKTQLDYQYKFLVLKHSSLTVSCICFSKTSLVL